MGPIGAIWALFGLLTTSPAEAPARFVIDPPACAPQWLDTISLEQMLSADTSTTTKAYIALIIPDCSAPSAIEFTILRPGRAPEGGRAQLDDVPTSFKLRTLSLGVAERLVFVPLARPARRPLRSKRVVTPKPVRPRPWSLWARSKILAGLQRGEVIAGLSVGVGRRLGPVDLEAEMMVATGRQDVAADAARLWLAEAQVSGLWLVQGLGATWRAGPQVGLGFGQVSGQSAQASQPAGRGRAATLWIGGIFGGLWKVHPAIALEAQLHARAFVVGIDGRHLGQVVVGLSGPYGGLGLGLQWSP